MDPETRDPLVELAARRLDRWAMALRLLAVLTLTVAGVLIILVLNGVYDWPTSRGVLPVMSVTDEWILIVLACVLEWLRRVMLAMGVYLRHLE